MLFLYIINIYVCMHVYVFIYIFYIHDTTTYHKISTLYSTIVFPWAVELQQMHVPADIKISSGPWSP